MRRRAKQIENRTTQTKANRNKASSLFLYSCVVSVLFSFCFAVPLQASNSRLKEGNRQFKNGHYDKALKIYDDALIDAPHSPVLRFNAGAAAYQSGDFARAEKEFQESGQASLLPLKNASHYNRGNALYRQSRYDEAMDAYKDALRINPKDENAKYNLSVAMRAKQNPPKPQPPSGKPQEQKGKPDKQESKAEQKKPSMNREDAERLLSAAAAGEKKKQQKAQGEGKQVDEDW